DQDRRYGGNPFWDCKKKMQDAAKRTNPFVDPSKPQRYELQREKYLPAAKKLCIAALASMRGGDLEWAARVFADYGKMYGLLNKNGSLARAYHSLTHAVLQIMPPEIVSIILRVQQQMENDPSGEVADQMVQEAIKNNPE